jgi:hypothetical protein
VAREPFVHDHPQFGDLLTIVAAGRGLAEALVEKDYWVTHTLWALRDAGLRVYFKGDTSLSKGFGLIQRFSEDLDVKLEAEDLPPVESWTSQGVTATTQREGFFRALEKRIPIPGADVEELFDLRDRSWRHAVFAVRYPGRAPDLLPEGIRPFVQLEVGSARVIPGAERPISSWVHDHLESEAAGLDSKYIDNRPKDVHCVSPDVTLLEKIEAVARRFSRASADPGSFVRHYEDMARIIDDLGPERRDELSSLLLIMREERDIREWPAPDHAAWDPDAEPERWAEVEQAWAAIGPMFWGGRIPLVECAAKTRRLLRRLSER